MYTNYIKNFNADEFDKLYQNLMSARKDTTPLWAGTIYIGAQPLYIECFVQWLAEKIDDYFVKTLPGEHVAGAKELYVLNNGVKDFIDCPNIWTTNVFWIGDDIYKNPDLVVHHNCLFGKWGDVSIVSVDDDTQSNFYHLGENHLLMRLFRYIFDDESNIVLHGAVVGTDNFGVLITGLSGAGKSTLAAKCLEMSAKFVGDDRIALHAENGAVYANPIYSTISLFQPINGIKTNKTFRPEGCTKDILILDSSQISNRIKVNAVIEPHKKNLESPVLVKTAPAPVLTRICFDYSKFSLLTRSMNPLGDYKKIAKLFSNVDVYSLELSKSIEDNARAIYNLIINGGQNV